MKDPEKKRFYHPTGCDKAGWQITIPSRAKRYREYSCEIFPNGILMYRPKFARGVSLADLYENEFVEKCKRILEEMKAEVQNGR